MYRPLSLFIALRYIRAKRDNRFISFISMTSMIGIALGVAILITVISVMNGFDEQIKDRIFTMVPHVTVSTYDNKLESWEEVASKIKQEPHVVGFSPYVSGQGLISNGGIVRPILMFGIDPATQNRVSVLGSKIFAGSINNLKQGEFGIVLGVNLAAYVGANVGDKVNIFIPQASVTPIGMVPRFKRFTVVGIFKVGTGFGFDEGYGFVELNDAKTLYSLGNAVSGIQLKVDDIFHADFVANRISKILNMNYQVSSWTGQYGGFYHAVQMEKNMMFLILLMLVAIAAFNLVSGLVMLVNDKRPDIAILRTFGATPKFIVKIFIIQGMIIGLFGLALGVGLGVFLSLNATAIVNFIQTTFHVELLTSNVYFVDYLPSKLQLSDILHISTVAFLMSLIATIYPALRAARTEPVEALRYE